MEKLSGTIQAKKVTPRIQTTLGDLIEAILQVAEQAGKSKEECYELASMTLENVLARAQARKIKMH